ncbi:hypothetical protein GCM10011369_23340 [Neiella marina]|uniref:Uncharacterized protein n=1 Tax=Neiella marina TaxID=508461 RepID=A0A8J2XMS2_9GAMM|nr:hypothetical protein [Neiella marina]GGA80717.1 hypothetical protein GCM10011369_23340 [Neiella marina]
MNQVEIAKHLDLSDRQLRDVLKRLGLDHKSDSLEAIRLAYIRDLREKAAGRTPTETRHRLDEAKTREALASAQMKELDLYKEHKLILDLEQVREAMEQWVTVAKSEYENSVEKIIALIEDQQGVSIDREPISGIIDATCRVIGDYRIKSE